MTGFDMLLLASTSAAPLVLAVIGELLVQRSGIINVGLEGLMLAGALGSVIVAASTGSAPLALAGGVAAAAIPAVLFGLVVFRWQGDQIVAGIAINFLVAGSTAVAYRAFAIRSAYRPGSALEAAIALDLVVIAAWTILPLATGILLWRTTIGLRLRAAGESPLALEAAGHQTTSQRTLALAIEAILAGLAGAYLALALSSGFAENMTAGRGFIALAVVTLARWRLSSALAGALLFGLVGVAQYSIQASAPSFGFHPMLALPYLASLLVLAIAGGSDRAPASLGR